MKKTTRKQLRTIRRRRLALALVGAMAMPILPAMAQSLPSSGDVVNGSATIGSAGNQMTVTQTTKGAIIDWGSFNIGAGYGVTFDQQFGTSSVTLNRVVGFGYGINASNIDGTLTSNGNVFIINPAGITFGNNAQVNVGGIVASTLWMNAGDFINGLATGQYVFTGFNGDTSATHQVRNFGEIIAGAGGVGLVGQTVWNSGSITSSGGNIVAGAGTQVTLDLVGDGLTQVTINVPPTVDSAIVQDRFGTMTADGGRILLRSATTAGGTGGQVYASGTLRAQSIANVNGRIELTTNGGVMLGAPGIFSDAGSPFTAGTLDVSGQAGENGGSVLIQGDSFWMVNNDGTPFTPADPLSTGSMIIASGGVNGGQVDIQTINGVLGLPLSLISADGTNGNGGDVRIQAGGDILLAGTDITASSKITNGGTIAMQSVNGGIALANSTLSASGPGNGGSIGLFALQDTLAIGGATGSFVNASGGVNGGSVTGVATNVLIDETAEIHADGSTGTGGLVGLRGTTQFAAYGLLSAHGNTTGGSIITATDGTFDIRGLLVDAGADAGTAGSWLLSAPTINVINGNAVGGVGAPALGNNVQDAEINYAFLTGTSVVLQSTDDVFFDDAQIVANSALPLSFSVEAGGEIAGNAFSITSIGGPLDMVFNSNAGGLNPGFSGIAFSNATLDSNGGDIAMYGQSDPLNGTASGYDSGIEISDSTIGTGGGSLSLRGSSTGADPGANAAGVLLDAVDIDTAGGAIDLYGLGAGTTNGVVALNSQVNGGSVAIQGIAEGTGDGVNLYFVDIDAVSGDVAIDGQSADGDGLYAYGSNIVTSGGDIALTGIGGARGLFFDGDSNQLYSDGGDIVVRGEGVTGVGAYVSALVDSGGGDITMYGLSTAAIGLDFGGGYYSGIISDGGDISLTGIGATHGVQLQPAAFGGGSAIDSAGGEITVAGTASAADGIGVYSNGVDLIGGTGDVTVAGTAPLGVGILLGGGAGISTTTGAIALYGTGADFGLDIADGAIDTDSGDITLEGTATAATAIAGVRVTGPGLVTNGGDITVTGSSAGGVGVQLGDGVAFAIDSGGGDIDIYGYSAAAEGLVFNGGFFDGISSDGGDIRLEGVGATAGTVLIGSGYGSNSIDSAGGLITILGTASGADAVGVLLSSLAVVGGAGDVSITGLSPAGTGILFENGAGVSTITGEIGLYGTGADFGLDIADGAIDTDSGDITLEGTATAATAIAGVRVTGPGLVTNGGDIRVTGTSAGGVGVQLGDGSAFAIGSGGGAITIDGTGIDAGVLMQGNQVASGGGAVSITGAGADVGVSLDGSDVDSAGGDLDVDGTASGAGGVGVSLYAAQLAGGAGDVTVTGTSAAGIGIAMANGSSVSTTTGAIGLYGTGADFGLDIADGALDTDSGDITLEGTATAATAIAGVRVTGDGLVTNGGDITVTGTSAGGVGVQLGDGSTFAIGSGGGAITIDGVGIDAGVLMQGNQVASSGGAVSIIGYGADVGVSLDGSEVDSAGGAIDVEGTASALGGVGIDLTGVRLLAAGGRVNIFGNAGSGTGVRFDSASAIATTTGDISLTGIGQDVGLAINGGEFTTDSGHIDLRGRGTGAESAGLVIGNGASIATDGGGIALSGEGGNGAGISIGAGSLVDAGDSLIVLRAANDGSSDAIRLQGAIRSGTGVNLRPGGVDANGGLVDHVDDEILIGGATGFALDGAELALIDTPELIIGSNLHAGAIQVLGAVTRDGNLTLQNNGGTGGIDLQAALNVGNHTLGLSSGGSITQTSAGVITAHSLLAQAGGDVLLAAALNDVANTTLAGSAGGDFEFQDANTLAIGSVSAIGFDASSGQLSSFASTGIAAGGDAFVRNLQGDLTLNAGVTATNIDLVTAGRLQNVAGANLVASGDWRVWANTWDGETRGGLAGDGNLPNLYGCAYLGPCGVTVTSGDNHFIYVQQPIALITFDDATREYGLPNPLFTFSVSGAILGDTAANVATGVATTTATIGSDVGLYPILGNFTSAAGYQIQFVPGTLAITPATLLFTADGAIRYLGFPNPDFTGTVTGFRNGDTVASVFGDAVIWSSPAGPLSPIGYYPVIGGTSARNYVFAQAPGNATALQIIPLPQLPATPVEFVRETVNTYVYDRNFGGAPVCAVNASIDDTGLAANGDGLSTEWTKVRSRPNLTNCFDSERENGCGNF